MWSEYNRLSKYKGNLSKGSSEVSSVNSGISKLNSQLQNAVKGDYYGVSSWEFNLLKEKYPDEDSYISSAKSDVQNELNAMKIEIEAVIERQRKAEEARKKAAEEAKKNAEKAKTGSGKKNS